MEIMVELKKLDRDRSLVLWVQPGGYKQFVVCSYYDDTRPMGERWSWGHYFEDLDSALDYVIAEKLGAVKEV